MSKFNVEGARTRDGFTVFNDVAKILKYLYASKDHFIEVDGRNLIMDSDKNLLLRPVEVNGEKITSSRDDGFYICQNSISYIQLMEIAEKLREEGKMDDIAVSVVYSETSHW